MADYELENEQTFWNSGGFEALAALIDKPCCLPVVIREAVLFACRIGQHKTGVDYSLSAS